ncbi:MAG: hypothetical protein H7241_11200 [Novosphingobium sp.]|nr:hypothetical protein [Novosphingobium sp.]
MALARFLTSSVGRAALISVMAMAAMNLVVLDHSLGGGFANGAFERPHLVATASAVTGELA